MQPDLDELLHEQSGLVNRAQVLSLGPTDAFIERQLRRRAWARVHTGVYVDHTGQLTWLQRAWAAVLFYAPAALSHESALRIAEGRANRLHLVTERAPIHVAVAEARRVDPLPGVQIHRLRHFDHVVPAHPAPRRVRLEHAVLDVASLDDREAGAVAVLADACQQRLTTPARLVAALEARPRLRHRKLLRAILSDVASGTYSVLERRYLVRVERPHGLPVGHRQRRVKQGRTIAYRDVEYVELATVVELDGRLGHEKARDRWADMDRDVESAIEGAVTLRLGWRHVLDPCRTAAAVSRLLIGRGWREQPRNCGPGCPVRAVTGGSSATIADDPPAIA